MLPFNLMRGRLDVDCGCNGPAGRQLLSVPLVVRNGALILILATCALPGRDREWVGLDTLTVVGGVLVLALLYAAVDLFIARLVSASALREQE